MHEHPRSASSWTEPAMQKLLKLPGINKYDLDMCCYNLRTADGRLAKKPTSIVTNSSILGKHMAKKCPGTHQHGLLKGGTRCQRAATYTREFCEQVVEGFKLHRRRWNTKKQKGSLTSRDTLDSDLNLLEIGADDPDDMPNVETLCEIYSSNGSANDSSCMSFNLWPRSGEGTAVVIKSSEVHHIDKGAEHYSRQTIDDIGEEEMIAWDDVKQCELDPKEVVRARNTEMGFVKRHKVYEYSTISECRRVTGCDPVGTKWLDTNKGDNKAPNYRSRWVAQQYRKAWVESIFSATQTWRRCDYCLPMPPVAVGRSAQ